MSFTIDHGKENRIENKFMTPPTRPFFFCMSYCLLSDADESFRLTGSTCGAGPASTRDWISSLPTKTVN